MSGRPHADLSVERHQDEILKNLRSWRARPVLRAIYTRDHQRIASLIDRSTHGRIVELGSGIGAFRATVPDVLLTDRFVNPWLDLACDAYELPFAAGSVSHLVLFDVLHHLRSPRAFLREAARVLAPRGRVILYDLYMSLLSLPLFALLHPEPVAWHDPIDDRAEPGPSDYYSAQGNATRLFFGGARPAWLADWEVFHTARYSGLAYLFAGGYSRPTLYPLALLPLLQTLDAALSHVPAVFGVRCVVGLTMRR